MSKSISNSMALIKEMRMQYQSGDGALGPERVYGSIKRSNPLTSMNYMSRAKIFEDDVNSLLNNIEMIFDEAHDQKLTTWRH